MAQPTFSKDELAKYFEHIELPRKYRDALLEEPSADSNSATPLDAALLTSLHVHQIAAIPYENLSLHYSQAKTLSLDPHDLYAKFITKGGRRGGYCMEDSIFFLHVLRSIGFDAYPTGVRIRLREDGVPKGLYTGLVHMVLVVELQTTGERYICDVAFGGDGPTVPLPLQVDAVTRNMGTQEVRYVYDFVPQVGPVGTRPGAPRRRYWIYQYRNGADRGWNSFYAFDPETEFFESDFQVMNFYTSQGQTVQRTMVLVVKFGLDRQKDEESTAETRIGSKLMLVNGTAKRNLGGKTEVVQECRTEAERIEALKQWFGIKLTPEEIAGIEGGVTELKDVEVVDA